MNNKYSLLQVCKCLKKNKEMKSNLNKKFYLKEIFYMLIITVAIGIYLKIPYKVLDLYAIEYEILDKSQNKTQLFLNENIDYSIGFKNTFYYTLPLTQIIEYKKNLFIYNLILKDKEGKNLSKEEMSILNKASQFYDLKKYIKDPTNLKYTLYQFLGVLPILCFLLLIYFTLRYRNPRLLKSFYLLLILYTYTSFVFLGLNNLTEKSIHNALKESIY